MNADTVLLAGGPVVTVDGDNTIHDPGWVLVEGRDIAAVGSGEAPPEVRQRAGRTIDTSGRAVMPGMTNGHTHLFQTFFRGLADDKPLLQWIKDCIWPGAVHLEARTAGLAATLGLAENLRTGATTVVDHQYVHVDPAIDDAVCEAADRLGIRFLLARGWADRNYEPRLMETTQQILERADEVRSRWHGQRGDRIRVGLAPLIPWGCSDDAMHATVGAARSWGGGTHIHCAETAEEIEISLEERGLRHVEWLDHLGLLGPDVQLAHSVWLDDDELDTVAARGAVVVHCPVSNMYLASGVPRIVEMRERDIPIALASDGPGSNNRQDMFEVLKHTVLLQKVSRLDAMALQPEDALEMACRGGQAVWGPEIGSITAGSRADLVVVDLRSVFVAPVHRVASALVFCATPAQVTHVMVDGAVVLDEGQLLTVDESALIEEAERAARDLWGRAAVDSRLRR